MQFTLATLLALAASASALMISAPSMGENVDFSKDYTVKWSSVNTDPSTFGLSVVNQAGGSTPFNQVIAQSVNTADGSYTIKAGTVTASAGKTYQVNFLANSGMNTGILAQSNQFNITSAGSSSSSSSSSSTSSSSSSSSTSASLTTLTSTGSSTTATSTSTLSGSSSSGTATSTKPAVATSTGGAARNAAGALGLAVALVAIVA